MRIFLNGRMESETRYESFSETFLTSEDNDQLGLYKARMKIFEVLMPFIHDNPSSLHFVVIKEDLGRDPLQVIAQCIWDKEVSHITAAEFWTLLQSETGQWRVLFTTPSAEVIS